MGDATREPLDVSGLRTTRLADRASLVHADQVGRLAPDAQPVADWVDTLPRVLAGNVLREVCEAICRARQAGKGVVAAIGAHVVKVGCSPYLADWIDRGVLTALAMNGAVAVHDFELAVVGKTSEDVAQSLPDGRFGMAAETAQAMQDACVYAQQHQVGLGQAMGEVILSQPAAHPELSLLGAAARRKIPATVHVAIGTDVVHMHPGLDGAALGEATLRDFRILCRTVAGLDHGVWMNLGSAVVLPEVLLKAVSVARNLGHNLDRLTTFNLDMIQHYRARTNVLGRPAHRGLALTGHHELMIPLLHAIVRARLGTDHIEDTRGQ